MQSIFVWSMIKQSESLRTKYDSTYINDKYVVYAYVLLLVWKDACFNYREFDLEGDRVGVLHA